MSDFSHRIMALKAEVEALKTARRKSSTTLMTITKTVACTATLKNVNNVVLCQKAAGVAIIPTDGNDEFLYSVAIEPYANRGRDVETYNWLFDDEAMGVMCVPRSSDQDDGMTSGQTKTINIQVKITATSNFATETSQITFNEV